MNSPVVTPIAPSTHPALDLIALAQLSPEEAGQRLRALLLGNPKYFGNVPLTSFNAVLRIQEDTTYESISCVAYDAQLKQLRATIDIKRAVGYSGVARINGSEEFVRFYVSYDGGAKWLDQGMRSVNVEDAIVPRPLVHEVILPIAVRETNRFPETAAQGTGHSLVELIAPCRCAQLDPNLGQCRGIRYADQGFAGEL